MSFCWCAILKTEHYIHGSATKCRQSLPFVNIWRYSFRRKGKRETESAKQEGHGNRMGSEAAPFAFAVRFVVHLQRCTMMRSQHGIAYAGMPAARSPCTGVPTRRAIYSALSSVISKFSTLPAISWFKSTVTAASVISAMRAGTGWPKLSRSRTWSPTFISSGLGT